MASAVGSSPRCGTGPAEKKVEKTDVDEALSARDWSQLPLDALASVFGKLGAIEILMGAGLVCRTWLAAAKLPDLWRSVDMEDHKVVAEIEEVRLDSYRSPKPKMNCDLLCAMARVAVDRSGGQMEVFVGKLFVTDELLKYIGDRSPALKTLGLISCLDVCNQGLTHLMAKCPMLEDLKLLFCSNVRGRDVYEAAGTACAGLKHFTLRKGWFAHVMIRSPGEALGIAAMHELRSLTLVNNDVTNDELASVLDGCPHLELLHLRGCFNIQTTNALRARCAGITSLMLPSVIRDYGEDDTFVATDCDYAGITSLVLPSIIIQDYSEDDTFVATDCDYGDYWDGVSD